MYNGIGLQTPRGSGTNGYIQTNRFHVRSRPAKVETKVFQEGQGAGGVTRKANKDILEHDRKRKIELEVAKLEMDLVDRGFTDEEIQERIAEARKRLNEAAADGSKPQIQEKVRETESHHIAALKEKKMEVFNKALGGRRKEGEAFDRELLLAEKEERKQHFEERNRQKLEEQKKRKEEKELREREREKEEKEREKRRREDRKKRERERDAEETRKEKYRSADEDDSRKDGNKMHRASKDEETRNDKNKQRGGKVEDAGKSNSEDDGRRADRWRPSPRSDSDSEDERRHTRRKA